MDKNYTFKIAAQAGCKGTWTLLLETDSLTLKAENGEDSFLIPRTEAEEQAELRESKLTDPLLIISIQKKKMVFKLGHAQAALLKRWFGPLTIRSLKIALKRRLQWSLPIGILFVITSIPLPADPSSGVEAVPFDIVSALLGITLIMMAILARVWPRRILFLLDGIWFSLLSLDVLMDIFRGGSPWWGILVIFLIFGAKGGFAEYKRFASFSTKTNSEP